MEGADVFNTTSTVLSYSPSDVGVGIAAVIIPLGVFIVVGIGFLWCCCRDERRAAKYELQTGEEEKVASPRQGTVPQASLPEAQGGGEGEGEGEVEEERELSPSDIVDMSFQRDVTQMPPAPPPPPPQSEAHMVMSTADPIPLTSAPSGLPPTSDGATSLAPPDSSVVDVPYSAPSPSLGVLEETREYREDPEDGQHYDIQSFYEAYGSAEGDRRWEGSIATARHIPITDLQGVL